MALGQKANLHLHKEIKLLFWSGQHGGDVNYNNWTRSGGGGGASWVCNETRTTLYCVGGGGGGAQAGWRNNRQCVDDTEPGANGGTVNDDGSIPITDVSYRDLAPGMYDAPNGVGGYYGGNRSMLVVEQMGDIKWYRDGVRWN